MKTLKLAVENGRWDLAAHVIVLATVRVLNAEVKSHGKERKEKKRRTKGQS